MAEIRFEYRPLPVYRPFHSSADQEKLLVGGMGSGKTVALCAEAIAFGLEQPGARILMTRKTAPELRDTLEPEFINVLPDALYQASEERRSGGHIESITLPNGTQFLFRSIDDWRKLKSLNLAAIFWDELSEFDMETYLGMRGRLRQREPTSAAKRAGCTRNITRRVCVAASNPEGHDFMWEHFVRDGNGSYWQATSLDNPFLPREYLDNLLSFPEAWVRRYVLCSFDDFGGAVYPDWTWETHVLTQKLRIDHASVTWMGMDPGTRNPTAGLWVVVDKPNNRLVGVAEYEANYTSAEDHAKAWRGIEKALPPVKWRVSDPNSLPATDRGVNMTLEDQYRRLGFRFDYGPSRPQIRIPMLGALIKAKRFVLAPSCPRTFQAIQNSRWRDLSPAQRQRGEQPREERLKKEGSDLVDCAEYLSSRWVRPLKPGTYTANLSDRELRDREIHRAAKRQLVARRARVSVSDAGVV